MTEEPDRILDHVRETLGAERLDGAITYLSESLVRGGARVRFRDVEFDIPWDAHLIFVDLEPGVNWGHACCYLAIREDGEEVVQVAARMPPFLKRETSDFRLLWRGPLAPEWAVETNPD